MTGTGRFSRVVGCHRIAAETLSADLRRSDPRQTLSPALLSYPRIAFGEAMLCFERDLRVPLRSVTSLVRVYIVRSLLYHAQMNL